MGVLRREPRERPLIKAVTPLQIGEVWYAKLPGDQDLSNVSVEEITERTAVLTQDGGDPLRYARIDVEFVERVPRNVD